MTIKETQIQTKSRLFEIIAAGTRDIFIPQLACDCRQAGGWWPGAALTTDTPLHVFGSDSRNSPGEYGRLQRGVEWTQGTSTQLDSGDLAICLGAGRVPGEPGASLGSEDEEGTWCGS